MQPTVMQCANTTPTVRTTTSSGASGSGAWIATPSLDRRFVWYNWLLLAELDGLDHEGDGQPDNTVLRRYTWGLDLAGLNGQGNSLQAAGGIGGLLAMRNLAETPNRAYVYFADGNGNVTQAIKRAGGTIAARYEYDAYGNNLLDASDPNESGPLAGDNPFRFSTKYYDGELDDPATTANEGMYYYGYRYYLPRLGCWESRDPIGEAGHIILRTIMRRQTLPRVAKPHYNGHVYIYTKSDPVNSFDAYALETTKVAIECVGVWRRFLGIPVKLGNHCSVVASYGGETLRWEDVGWTPPQGGVDGDDPNNPENARKRESPLGSDYLDDPGKTSWTRYEAVCRDETCRCERLSCFKEAIRAANFGPYVPSGPNSNTFARALLAKCGCHFRAIARYGYTRGGIRYRMGTDVQPRWAPGWNTSPPDYWGGWEWNCGVSGMPH